MQMDKLNDRMGNLPWAHLRLPPFPQIAIRVLQLVGDENMQLRQLRDLISSDPAFASEVLTVANSVLYAPHYSSSSILEAIAVLGANTLQDMCITVGIRAYLGASMSIPSMRRLWHHNLACALIAEQLASAGSMDKDIAYTSGILHDIGRMALAVIQPQGYATLLKTHHGSAHSILQGERELFGWDHCETGLQLIGDWKLPSDFEAVVSEHHSARRENSDWTMAELIKVSCKMADVAGFAAFPGCDVTPYPELLNELPAHERRLFHPDVETLTSEVANGIQGIESI
jgi:putative nucleotidyltransferase with HDIG domain